MMNRELRAKIVLEFGCQANFSEKTGISEPRLSRIINGRERPKPQEIAIFREKLGVILCDPEGPRAA